MSTDRGTSGLDAILVQLDRVKNYWWLVVAVVALSVAAAIASTLTSPTTYTARASLIVSSNDRAPDQDAVLVQGYVAYFNDPAYQSQLLADTKVVGVTVEAHAAASSPILLVEATGPEAATARSAAARVAVAFEKAINRVRSRENKADIADLQERLDAIRVTGDNSQAATSEMSNLQDRILQIQADRVNMLRELQLDAGVTESSPRLSSNLFLALFGGTLVGLLVALAVDAITSQLRNRSNMAGRLGLSVLGQIPSRKDASNPSRRHIRFQQLAQTVKAGMSESAVLAVTEAATGNGSSGVAFDLAREWAEQGFPTLLVRANSESEESFAVAEGIDQVELDLSLGNLFGTAVGTAIARWVTKGPIDGMWVLEPGRMPIDGEDAFPADVLYQLLAHGDSSHVLVILEAPAVVGSADAQVLCAAAGRTILVIDTSLTRFEDASEAVSVLRHLDSGLLGAVLVDEVGDQGDSLGAGPVGKPPNQGSVPHSDGQAEQSERLSALLTGTDEGRLARVRAHLTGRVRAGEQ